jgi:predicted nucleic acid-binding Zn ribbon protein
MSDSSLKVCPECGIEALRKVFSPTGLVFKGAVSYKNENRTCTPSASCDPGTCPMANSDF